MTDDDDPFAPRPLDSIPPLPLDAGIALLARAIRLAIDMAAGIDELHDTLRANRAQIDRVGAHRPDLWADLRAHTNRRRGEFTRLTGDSPTAA
jgi:hypothetical protein